MGASLVVLTDGDDDALDGATDNAVRNGLAVDAGDGDDSYDASAAAAAATVVVQCRRLIWGCGLERFARECCCIRGGYDSVGNVNQQGERRFDTVLGSDVVYDDGAIEPLLRTVKRLLDPRHGTFLLSYTKRNVPLQRVLDEAKRQGMGRCSGSGSRPDVDDNVDDHDGAEGVYAFRMRPDGGC